MTFRFSTEGTGFRYLSNQAVRLALPGVNDPWGALRTFSLASSPTEPGHVTITCKISDTPYKQALARLAPGDEATLFGPIGRFLLDAERPSVFLAGGIGVTPFRGMIRYAHDRKLVAPRVLLYCARTPEELLFRPEFDRIAAESPAVRVHYSVTRPAEANGSWSGRVGRIDGDWIQRATHALHEPRYYVAGLPEIVREMLHVLEERFHVPPADVTFEIFKGF
jgi:ferredoxin-NADP reductase